MNSRKTHSFSKPRTALAAALCFLFLSTGVGCDDDDITLHVPDDQTIDAPDDPVPPDPEPAPDDDPAPDQPDAGSPDDGAPDGGPGADTCGLDCGPGYCDWVDTEVERCVCPAPFAGESCELCVAGHTGDDCSECADGYFPDPTAPRVCRPDPCAADPCGESGECAVVPDASGALQIECRCDDGFEGEFCEECTEGRTGSDCGTCAPDYERDAAGTCVVSVCVEIPCSDNGECVDRDGAAVCLCEEGWTGRDCGTCAPGYVERGDACVLDLCASTACDQGICRPDTAGATGVCHCDPGYGGDACDECAPGYTFDDIAGAPGCYNVLPMRDSRVLAWFDAKSAHTYTVEAGGVSRWYQRIEGAPGFEQLHPDRRPDPTTSPEGITFDGSGANMYSVGKLFGSPIEDVTGFAVVSWDTTLPLAMPLISAHHVGLSDEHFSGEVLIDGDEVRHTTHSDSVSHIGFGASTGPRLIVFKRRALPNATALTVGNGTGETAAVGAPAVHPDPYHMHLGTPNLSDHDANFEGTIHELVILEGDVPIVEQEAIRAYLTVRWGL